MKNSVQAGISNIRDILGLRSDLGRQVLTWLEEQVSQNPKREELVGDWLKAVGTGGLEHKKSRQLLRPTGVPGLGPEEVLMCRQTYYAVVIQLSAWNYLVVRKGGAARAEGGLKSISNGQIFREMGIENLGLEGLPVWHVDENDSWPEPFRALLALLWRLNLTQHKPGDWFSELYMDLLPREVRHAMGEHYTPPWLAVHVLGQAGVLNDDSATMLDPSCGSGVFLAELLRERASRQGTADLNKVAGFDINPLAVLTARVNCLIASGFTPAAGTCISIPVYRKDVVLAVLSEQMKTPGDRESDRFDYVIGNPPWINWETLPKEYRAATLELWKHYGLFAHSGMDVILGKGKKDFSTLMTLVCADRYLKDRGRLAFIITESALKSGGAADGFRRFELPGGVPLKVLMAEDLMDINPFPEASNRPAVIYLERGEPTRYPVPYRKWRRAEVSDDGPSTLRAIELWAEPVNLDEPASPWLTCRPECRTALRRILGSSDYEAREGANTGGANGVFWLEVLEHPAAGLVRVRNMAARSHRRIPPVEMVIEEDLVYPLIKGRDVKRWEAQPSAYILLVQDPKTRQGIPLKEMEARYSLTLQYLKEFEQILRERAAFKRYFKENHAFYSMFNIGEYTLAHCKVVWQRFGRRLEAAVVEGFPKPVICQETQCLIACDSSDEAWYLAGLLNSLPVEYAVKSYSMVGGKSFASPHLVRFVRLPRFTADKEQTAIVKAARAAADGLGSMRELNEAVAEFYGISSKQLNMMEEALGELA